MVAKNSTRNVFAKNAFGFGEKEKRINLFWRTVLALFSSVFSRFNWVTKICVILRKMRQPNYFKCNTHIFSFWKEKNVSSLVLELSWVLPFLLVPFQESNFLFLILSSVSVTSNSHLHEIRDTRKKCAPKFEKVSKFKTTTTFPLPESVFFRGMERACRIDGGAEETS